MRLKARVRGVWARIKEGLLEVLYPDDLKCVICGEELTREEHRVCHRCAADLTEISGAVCPKCGNVLNENGTCPDCAGNRFAFRSLRSVYPYEGAVKNAVLSRKDGGKPWLSDWVAEHLFLRLDKEAAYDAILYPPSSAKTVKRRGFDHMKLVADRLSIRTGIPSIQPFETHRTGEKQARKGKDERRKTAELSYALRSAPAGTHFLLIDDVATTCATLDALSRLLLAEVPGAEIDCLTFARTFLK